MNFYETLKNYGGLSELYARDAGHRLLGLTAWADQNPKDAFALMSKKSRAQVIDTVERLLDKEGA